MENFKRRKDVMSPSEKVNLPEKVANFYYSHGLLCSSHPALVLCFAISIIFLCSYPLINLPLPGDTPIQTITSSHNLSVPDNLTMFSGKPAAYIQQIVLKTGVSPWQEGMTVCDAFRAPLHQVFSLLEMVRNFQLENGSRSLSDLCLHVEAVKFKSSEERKKLLPEYNCLVLSPANFWQQNENNFQSDANLMGTVFNYHNIQKGKISLTEILFGVNMKESGLKRHPLRSRPRILQYAITLVLSTYDQKYISGLRSKLEHQFPLHTGPDDPSNGSSSHRQAEETVHVFYPGEFNLHELLPLATVFLLLFLYIYYSLRKVEPVKSKLGIAFSAVVSIFSCLCMSIGLCFFFGLTVSVNGREIFPYLVVIVGLENVLVITKSITTTPALLDVKIRVAQGLSREGWSITKNLLIQVTILTIGFGTFVSAIQELCILGIVGLVCDFFLQLFFFTTILSIDIHRTESDLEFRNNYYYHSLPAQKVLTSNKFVTAQYDKSYLKYCTQETKNLIRSKSHHNLSSGFASSSAQSSSAYPANVLAQSSPMLTKIPKRLKLVNVWASTRFFQRAFMVALVMWMCFILYTAKLVQQVLQVDEIAKFHEKLQVPIVHRKVAGNTVVEGMNELKSFSTLMSDESSSANHRHEGDVFEMEDADLNRFRHRDQDSHRRLSLYHWPAMMSLYNISLTGKYITILPSIRISHTVSPESAIFMRNPNEKMTNFQWKSLAVALDPLDFSTSDVSKASSLLTENTDSPFIPRSPMEIALSCILVAVSVFVLAYMTMVLYRCICSRNYAEWRSSWHSSTQLESDTQVVLEAVPTPLEGHAQEIECLSSDGILVVSSCLSGEIRVWNSSDGELVSQIDRQRHFLRCGYPAECSGPEPDRHSDYESCSPLAVGELDLAPRRKNSWKNEQGESAVFSLSATLKEKGVYKRKKQENDPGLKPNINFSGLRLSCSESGNQREKEKGFDFQMPYKRLHMEGESIEMEESGDKCGDEGREGESRYGSSDGGSYAESFGAESDTCVAGELSGSGDRSVPTIWCLDCSNNMVAVGCSNGRVEFWESPTGRLQCLFDEENVGVTSIKLFDNRVIAARLNGTLDILLLDRQTRRQSDWGFTPSRRSHVRTGSVGSVRDWEKCLEELKCRKVSSVKVHQQPITVLECESGRVVTGSQDHTLKVLRVDNCSLQYTLHGHCGPITCMFIDKVTPFLAGSGSHDGLLCFWDLLTGACLYSIQAHDGSICALTYSASYVISLGTDERICVWERFLGHLLNTIHVMHTFCSSMVMLTHNLLVTSKQGSLVMWDVRTGEPVRIVRLGDTDHSIFVKQILNLGGSVVCDYGSQLRIVKFPIITDKTE